MRIQLVQPYFNTGKRLPETPSRALLILGTLAKNAGYDVRIAHLDIESIDWEWKPDIVGITCNTFQIKNAREIVSMANNRGCMVIVGGPHAVAWDEKTDGNVDRVVVGEGENEWLEYIGGKPLKDVMDVDIDYSLVDLNRFSGVEPVGAYPSLAIMASRGCPYRCTFCNTPVLRGKKVRYREPDKVVREIMDLHVNHGIDEIFFQDDTFNLNHKWAFDVFDGLIESGLSDEMLFKICCRVNEKLITKEFLDKAKQAGVWNIFFGIESGSQEMLDRMHKDTTKEEALRAIRMTKEAGIKAQCSFIVGLPGESLKTLLETDDFVKELRPSWYGFSYACPFPGTEFDREVTESGHKVEIDYADYCYGNVYCRTDALDMNEIAAFKGFSYNG